VLSSRVGFTKEEVRRSRAYNRPRDIALVADLALAAGVLVLLRRVELPVPFWPAACLTPALVELLVAAARLPVGVWRLRHDRRFGLSTQAARGFAADAAKGAAVGAALTTAALAPLFALAHALPRAWPWLAAPGAALLALVVGFLAPVVLEPVFNRVRPLADEKLGQRLHALAAAVGAPVREILVADASRRTRRENAYVSGLGRTRRVVLWDTLLAAPADEIAVVLAHELGHRVRRHVALLAAVGAAAAAAFVVLLRLVLDRPRPADTGLVLLLGLGAEVAALPLLAALSRRLERSADRFSLAATGDRAAFLALHRRLALANLADLEPPKWLYYWSFTHPTATERLRDT